MRFWLCRKVQDFTFRTPSIRRDIKRVTDDQDDVSHTPAASDAIPIALEVLLAKE